MEKKRLLVLYSIFGITVSIATCVILSYAQIRTEKREVLLTTSFTIEAGEQKFKAFYLSSPAEGFLIHYNVSIGSIKFSPWPASSFEDSLGYIDHYINETTVEKRQVWFFEGNNGGVGCSVGDTDQVWYIQFYNEDPYAKEVNIQITRFWHVPIYQSWT